MKKTDRPENVFCSIFDPETNGNTVARIRWLRSFYLSRLSWFSRFIIVIIVRIMRQECTKMNFVFFSFLMRV